MASKRDLTGDEKEVISDEELRGCEQDVKRDQDRKSDERDPNGDKHDARGGTHSPKSDGDGDVSSIATTLERIERRSILSDIEFAPDEGRVGLDFGGRADSLVNLLRPINSVSAFPPRPDSQTLVEDLSSPCPFLNIVIQVVGTRGDVQPFIALAHELRKFGHRVRIATHAAFQAFVEDEGLEFFSIGGDPNALMAFMVKNPSLLPSMATIRSGDISKRRRDVGEILHGCWRSCIEEGNGLTPEPPDPVIPFVADAIIANPPSFAHVHCAERLAIPVHMMFTMPWTPTTDFSHPLSNVKVSKAENAGSANYVSYMLMELLTWQGVGDLINNFREMTLGLDTVGPIWMARLAQRLCIPFTYCWSPALIPKPADWGRQIAISGFYFLNPPTNYAPPQDLKQFLAAGPPPVYIGFGSIVIDDPEGLTILVYAAVEKSGVRALLSRGSGGLGSPATRPPPNVFLLGDCPHSWLFQQVSVVVHHGGAGTTAAAIACGIPTVIVPFFGDQHFWGDMVARAGAGPRPINHQQLTVDNLTQAIEFAITPSTKSAAAELAAKIKAEDGSRMGAQHFHAELPRHRMACDLDPERAAVWTTKKGVSKIKISPAVAALLVKEGLLQFDDLSLYRVKEYETDPGPWEPVTASLTLAVSILGNVGQALGNLSWGLATATVRSSSPAPRPGSIARSATSTASSTVQPSPATFELAISEPRLHHHRAKRGLKTLATATLRAPVDLAVVTAQGLNNLPRLYNDNTTRPTPRVTGLQSGLKAAGSALALGVYDGISGVVTQPVRARHGGAGVVTAGVAKGISGALVKPLGGLSGFFGYAMKGVQRELQKAGPKGVKGRLRNARIEQGLREQNGIEAWKKEHVLSTWRGLVGEEEAVEGTRGKKEKGRETDEKKREKKREKRELKEEREREKRDIKDVKQTLKKEKQRQ